MRSLIWTRQGVVTGRGRHELQGCTSAVLGAVLPAAPCRSHPIPPTRSHSALCSRCTCASVGAAGSYLRRASTRPFPGTAVHHRQDRAEAAWPLPQGLPHHDLVGDAPLAAGEGRVLAIPGRLPPDPVKSACSETRGTKGEAVGGVG